MENLQLAKIANQVRKDIVTGVYNAKSGHPGGSLSAADMLTFLYFEEMNVSPEKAKDSNRDRFVLSKGHVAPALYSVLAEKGYFPREDIKTLRKPTSYLQGHPDMKKCPGIDISTGSLGQGFACGAGMALAAKLDGKDYRVFVVIGDGESQEGEIWEAAQVCNKYKLDNIVVFCDYNNLQLDGTCDEVMPVLDLAKKFESFGFECMTIDGNDMEQIVDALDKLCASKNGKPKFILGNTVKGKGVSFMENRGDWHGKAPNSEEYKAAMAELEEGARA